MTASCLLKNIASVLVLALAAPVSAASSQAPRPVPPPKAAPAATPAGAEGVPLPPGYVIGPEDVLSIVYWKDKDMTTEVQVRPDGRIALPLVNDIQASGRTPDQLRLALTEESKKYMEDPTITVVVRQILSRKVFITGEVSKAGTYALTSPMSVLQLIAMAGGLREYANSKKIVIMRTENGKPISLPFNYKEVVDGKNLAQNIELKPGDTVVVP